MIILLRLWDLADQNFVTLVSLSCWHDLLSSLAAAFDKAHLVPRYCHTDPKIKQSRLQESNKSLEKVRCFATSRAPVAPATAVVILLARFLSPISSSRRLSNIFCKIFILVSLLSRHDLLLCLVWPGFVLEKCTDFQKGHQMLFSICNCGSPLVHSHQNWRKLSFLLTDKSQLDWDVSMNI